MNKLILSISFCYHDSCITLSDGNSILLHLEAERYFRVKHKRVETIEEMDELIQTGLDYINKTIDDITEVIVAKWMNIYDEKFALILGRKFSYELSYHHNNHIGVTLPSKYDKCVIYVSDGGSECGTTKVYYKDNNKIYLKEDLDNFDYTGMFYGTIAQLVIDPDFDRAHTSGVGKLMGLSSCGEYSKDIEKIIKDNIKDLNKLNLNGVDYLLERFGLNNNYQIPWKDKKRVDLAATAHKLWVNKNVEILKKYNSYSNKICMTGGCALNISLNSKLLEDNIYEKVYTSPICTDSGQSLGAILYKYPNIKVDYPFVGRQFGKQIDFEINNIIDDLVNNKIIIWYDGKSEIGARALGHRSFIGLPDNIDQRKKISEEIKGREPYRPVAAMILEEDLGDYFYQSYLSPYMTFCSKAKQITYEKCPAIVHFDNTTRLQTISKENDYKIYMILKELKKRNIPPILMNTSLNIMGEPIVDTIEEALNVYKKSKADTIYINGRKWRN